MRQSIKDRIETLELKAVENEQLKPSLVYFLDQKSEAEAIGEYRNLHGNDPEYIYSIEVIDCR